MPCRRLPPDAAREGARAGPVAALRGGVQAGRARRPCWPSCRSPPDPFVVDLVAGRRGRPGPDRRLIAAHAIGWTLDRMPVVDRALLRMATFELLARPDVPTGVVISEAVELATQYSTEESGRFVNGVLATIAAIVRPAREPATPTTARTPTDSPCATARRPPAAGAD